MGSKFAVVSRLLEAVFDLQLVKFFACNFFDLLGVEHICSGSLFFERVDAVAKARLYRHSVSAGHSLAAFRGESGKHEVLALLRLTENQRFVKKVEITRAV